VNVKHELQSNSHEGPVVTDISIKSAVGGIRSGLTARFCVGLQWIAHCMREYRMALPAQVEATVVAKADLLPIAAVVRIPAREVARP
jgi:hypothetical protein